MPKLRVAALVLLGVALPWLAACARQEETFIDESETSFAKPPAPVALPEPVQAVAVLVARENLDAEATVIFTEEEGGVRLVAEVSGIEPGLHGLHLHELGDCSGPDFGSAGGHFDPTGAEHGGPDSEVRHAGDFGNVEVGEDGTGRLELFTDLLSLAEGPSSVIGRGLILHEGEDDLTSQPSGNAAGRLACGVVEAVGGVGEGESFEAGESAEEPSEEQESPE